MKYPEPIASVKLLERDLLKAELAQERMEKAVLLQQFIELENMASSAATEEVKKEKVESEVQEKVEEKVEEK